MFQTLGIWLLTTVAPVVRFAANAVGLFAVLGLAWYCISAVTDPNFEWAWPRFHFLFIAVGLRVLYELCVRGLSMLLPEEQSVIL